MKAVLKQIFSLVVDDLETFSPKIKDHFGFSIRLVFEGDTGLGEDCFDVVVCSPKWISQQLNKVGILNARHHLVMSEFDYPKLISYVREFTLTCRGEEWSDVAKKLSRLGKWEFED